MKKYRIALYIRLSLEDAKTDSMSISSQRSILREYASELPEYANAELTEFVDNGYSGANFERPAVQELLFNFQGTMKRSFTYSHRERSNAPPKREKYLRI